ncbi:MULTISPECIES: 23S rRNA pseudouridine(1911/1915/1917) synthase RluD [Marinobacter]|jgi:23S rRNA pseudouridine1911/1915/1917 synthase|uniref:Pseudouridine synthase n=2 Tax=Marinobacter TaxID=2742 RepID=A0ABV4W7P6_9GAMM|nr:MULTISPECIES: 23S rRNA pseudouridine(1911/1915/1917) synthase RluD [Marinobacter]MAO12714.1 23S rRNA pseudouridine(1911/1915/1917) synthase RluD [Marinobacter sp.]QFS85903.1 Ribosomal large subunit pseudouridine synthase D [Marinobacter sp. THAF197a]QFT49697.1 Ribosomal large subunit pseudouridine synthase D [Marinobacter sp. THAF39]|tara:strand:- start:249 stop:1226 length:978 start_codon:yes stop_codon:yes gene_type:complete
MSSNNRITGHYIVPPQLSDKRLDQAAAELMPEHSRSRLQSWIKSGALTVNGAVRKPRDKVMLDDVLDLDAEPEVQVTWEAEPISLDIVYEDEHLLVINKPAGLVVHPAAGHADGTLVNALLNHAPEVENLPRAGIVHRLDKDTSGIMVVARSLIAHTSLVDQLQTRTMGREYEAVVVGSLTGGATVDAPIGRHPQDRKRMAVVPSGKPAVTHYRLLERFAAHTHIQCKLESGRTHQIRVHMTHVRHPLVGDPAYGGRLRLPKGTTEELRQALAAFSRQALHARRLTLEHPETGETLSWEVPLPEDMVQLIEALRKHARELENSDF